MARGGGGARAGAKSGKKGIRTASGQQSYAHPSPFCHGHVDPSLTHVVTIVREGRLDLALVQGQAGLQRVGAARVGSALVLTVVVLSGGSSRCGRSIGGSGCGGSSSYCATPVSVSTVVGIPAVVSVPAVVSIPAVVGIPTIVGISSVTIAVVTCIATVAALIVVVASSAAVVVAGVGGSRDRDCISRRGRVGEGGGDGRGDRDIGPGD